MMPFPVAPPGAMMSIGFESDKVILEKLRERLRRMCIHWKQQRPCNGSETAAKNQGFAGRTARKW
jgi:hypothetical protein